MSTTPTTLSTRGWSGLTAWQVVRQSHLIHPDWAADIHGWYLVNEEGFAPGFVESLPLVAWLTDPTHPGYAAGPEKASEVAP